ncbi:MAG TPA: beta-ketoacyl-ACP synthase III [Actinomycetota bacterium]|jgi:3-oxoacyl-[acyl-carrier-protein] synthase-3
MNRRFASVMSTGAALGTRVVPNNELARNLDTSDEWIRSRTGIEARRFAGPGETASSLAARAAARAFEAARMDPAAVDLTIVATISGDQPLPSTASFVQDRLGIGGWAFDIGAACAGFVYAMEVGAAQIAAGSVDTVLVIGTEVLSRFLDFSDRTTCVLFGDGAGAAILRAAQEPGVVASVLETDGRSAGLLGIPAGGSSQPASLDTVGRSDHTIHMRDGSEVFRRAVEAMSEAASSLLEKSGLTADDVALLVPHQANARIIRSIAARLSFPDDRVFVDLAHVGNTSAASVPIALDKAWRSGRLQPGDVVLTAAFGAGLAWGANLIRWTAERPVAEAAV